MALIIAGENARAEELIALRYGESIPDSQHLLQAYYRTKNYPRVLGILEGRVTANPNNTQGITQLAAMYAEAGMKVKAVATMERAMALDPALEEQGRAFIEALR